MWYLDAFTIVSMFGVTVLLAVVGAWAGKYGNTLRKLVLVLFSIGFLAVYSQKLAVFSVLYAVGNYVLYRWLLAATGKWRKPLFAGVIIANIAALFGLRFYNEGMFSHPWFAPVLLLGLVYTLLKVINTFYHAYYVMEKPAPRLGEYVCYLLFIPTFTSGPIIKFHEFLKDLRSDRPLTSETLEWGVKRIIKGLFKKLVLVSLLLSVYDHLLAGQLNPGSSALVLLTFYIMLFFDFSGYSDIAVGFGHLFGIRVPENFKKPFSSPTLTQFWRNWHATLGDWFRDHVFSIWAGRAPSRVLSGIISLIVMLLVGLWHGIQPLFLLWGAYHGILLFLETVLHQTMVNKRKVSAAYYWSRCAVVNVLVAFGTIFFSADWHVAGKILKGFINW